MLPWQYGAKMLGVGCRRLVLFMLVVWEPKTNRSHHKMLLSYVNLYFLLVTFLCGLWWVLGVLLCTIKNIPKYITCERGRKYMLCQVNAHKLLSIVGRKNSFYFRKGSTFEPYCGQYVSPISHCFSWKLTIYIPTWWIFNKGWRDFIQQESHQQVFEDQLVFKESLTYLQKYSDSYIVLAEATWVIEFLRNHLVFKENSSLQLSNNDSYVEVYQSFYL